MFYASGKRNLGRKPSSVKPVPFQNKPEKSKRTDFGIFWSKLTSWLSNKQYIINWTVNSEEIGENFEPVYLGGGNYISVYPESARVQKVPKNDFKITYENWDGYVAELIPRSHFVHGPIAESRSTKYTISIIHQYMKCQSKN